MGPGIAHMVILLLWDDEKYRPAEHELCEVDVKADTHVRRVFYRAGLAQDQSEQASIAAARRWHPEFPGLLDWPAWTIGRKWCRQAQRNCWPCAVSRHCARNPD
ncbi:MAG: hypothetical protein HYY04_03720 [Chloroflexi bacterium]|nr:hypothetical protein [Chloroflexota bacterium]